MSEQLTIFEYTDEYKENQRIADIKLKQLARKISGNGIDVLSLFNGISCGRVALERAGIKVNRYVSYEIDNNANKVAQSNYPNDEYYGDVTTADFAQYKGFDLVIGGSPCFTKGHLVLTNKGYKDISEIDIGDYVLTHTGKYQKVIRTNKRQANIYDVKIMGYPTFKTTKNHPFYTITRNKSTYNEYKQTNSWRSFTTIPQWKEVKDLTKNDFCGQHISTNSDINTFNLDEETCWILGRYIADGHIRKAKRKDRKNSYQHQLILSIGEHKLNDFKQKIIKRHYSCYKHTKNVYRCVFSSMELVNFIIDNKFGRGAYNKQIPEFIFDLPNNLRLALLEGYISGDGCYSNEEYRMSTISPKLAMGLQRLITSIYKTNVGVSVNNRKHESIIDGRIIKNNYPCYTIQFKEEIRKQTVAHIQNGIMWTQVTSVIPTNNTETVYNIEVEKDNSYTVNNCIVHNCTYWSIAKQGRETTPNGEGGRLFMHFARAVKETECKFFLYENNHSIADKIKAFISNELGVDFIMINSALVSAQNRERCYWTNLPGIKQPEDKGILLENILESGVVDRDKSYVLMANYGNTTTREYFGHAQGQMKAIPINTSIDGKARTIKAQYSRTALANMAVNANYPATAIAKPVNLGHISNTNSQANRVYSVRGKSVCLQSEAGGGGAKTGLYKIDLPDGDYYIRKLTPVECERLQTLPDNYTAAVATTNRYKGIGNGWTVDVIAHIFQPLKRHVKEAK